MADLIAVSEGALPWAPGPEVSLIDVFDRHDVPTCGVVEQHGALHLFECVVGPGRQLSVWLYAPLAPADYELLKPLEGDALDACFERLLLAGCVRFAVARGDSGIVESGAVDEPSRSRPDLLVAVHRRLVQHAQELTQAAEATRLSDAS
jgi:hypothetical protein